MQWYMTGRFSRDKALADPDETDFLAMRSGLGRPFGRECRAIF